MMEMHDPYDDQLSAARYKAERDQARQRIAGLMKSVDDLDDENEHLRDMLNDVAWKLGIGREVNYLSGDNYDECHKRVLGEISKLSSPTSYDVAQVTASAYDLLPEEDRKAMRWVRDNGGLEDVKAKCYLADETARTVTGKAHGKTTSNDILANLQKRLMPEGYEWNDGFAGAVDFFEAMHDLLYTVDCDEDHDGPEMVLEVMRRLMPEGMEWLVEAWPRFEDGEPVRFLDDFERYGDENGVSVVTMYAGGSFALNCRAYSKGERVNRPAPKVLDADGVSIHEGDTVWLTDGRGPWKVSRIVCADRLRVICDDEGNGHLNVFPESITHRAPVLAADGRPLREGETVYLVRSGIELEVDTIFDPDCVACVKPGTGQEGGSLSADELTHQRPDSWERIEEDLQKSYTEYWGCADVMCNRCPAEIDGKKPHERFDACSHNCTSAMRHDIVRRCKALAERSE